MIFKSARWITLNSLSQYLNRSKLLKQHSGQFLSAKGRMRVLGLFHSSLVGTGLLRGDAPKPSHAKNFLGR